MKKALVVAAVQVIVLLGWAAHHERVRATAPTFRIPLRPVDPHDLLRGRYLVLNPRDADVTTGGEDAALRASEVERFLAGAASFDGPSRVGFCAVDGEERLCALAPPSGNLPEGPARFWSRARLNVFEEAVNERAGEARRDVRGRSYRVHVDLGVDRFFLPERLRLPAGENEPGWELELTHRDGLAPLPRRLWFRGKAIDTEGRGGP
ncbi:MAG: GDYXXLXY domain-containing protein [Thermoanaerobaculia bacterium]|nr:GDYXXLXY domain-containing protein [Thermoanaerobaculia bacterium]